MDYDEIDITGLLSSTEPGAVDRAFPHIYGELAKVASAYLARERDDHPLQTRDLVHETYMRLRNKDQVDWQSRKHFLVVAAKAMRHLLLDLARRRLTGEKVARKEQAITVGHIDGLPVDIIDLDAALVQLESENSTLAEVVQLKFFAGLPAKEIGPLLGLSPMAVSRRWWQAKQWLRVQLSP